MEVGGNNTGKANGMERNSLLLCFNEEKVKTFHISSFPRHSCRVRPSIPVSLTQHLSKVPSVDPQQLELSPVAALDVLAGWQTC